MRAHIILEAGVSLDEEEVRAYCRSQLAGYKVPATFTVDAEFPRNASGKVLKRELRAV